MPYYGPKQMICPKCKEVHTTMYGDVINPFDPALYCKKCKPSFSNLAAYLYETIIGKDEPKKSDKKPNN